MLSTVRAGRLGRQDNTPVEHPISGAFWRRDVRCPFCRHGDSRVVDSRDGDEGAVIRRRRSCLECGRRFSTVESVALHVLKRSGTLEPFNRGKITAGVRKACQGRPVDEDALARLAQHVEEIMRASGACEVPANEVGLAILQPLRRLDEVAYLRFASVYRGFDSLADFEHEIAVLRHEPEHDHPVTHSGLPDRDPSTVRMPALSPG